MDKEEMSRKRKEKWYEAWFIIEALGIDEDVVKKSLEKHAEKLSRVKNVSVYEKNAGAAKKVDKPMKGVETAYSQILEMKFFVKDLFTLLNLVLVYGPSSVEVLGPEKREVSMEEVQSLSNVLASLVHQFASAGVGGIVITPDNK